MKKISILIYTVIVVTIFVLYKPQEKQEMSEDNRKSAISVSQTIGYEKDSPNTQEYNIIEGHVLLDKIYRNIKELKDDSDLIIEGEVKNTKSLIYAQEPSTISEIKVYEVFKNIDDNIKTGSTICVIEIGGVMDKSFMLEELKMKFPNIFIDPNKIKPSKAILDGISPMEVGDHVVIFLRKPKVKINEKTCYSILGAYQGKFKIDNDDVRHQVPKDLEDKFEDKISSKKELIDLLSYTK